MMRKGQVNRLDGKDTMGQWTQGIDPQSSQPVVNRLDGKDTMGQAKFVASLFQIAA